MIGGCLTARRRNQSTVGDNGVGNAKPSKTRWCPEASREISQTRQSTPWITEPQKGDQHGFRRYSGELGRADIRLRGLCFELFIIAAVVISATNHGEMESHWDCS